MGAGFYSIGKNRLMPIFSIPQLRFRRQKNVVFAGCAGA
jgi:hypothetical protein